MYDGNQLGEAIAKSPDELKLALTAVERWMFERSAGAAAESLMHELLFGDASAEEWGVLMKRRNPFAASIADKN